MVIDIEAIKENILSKEPELAKMLEVVGESIDIFDYPKIMQAVNTGLSIGNSILKENSVGSVNTLNQAETLWSKYEKSATAEDEADVYRRLILEYYKPIVKGLLKAYTIVEIQNEALSRMNKNAGKIIQSFESTKIQAEQLNLIKDIKEKEGDRMKDLLEKVLDYKKDERKDIAQSMGTGADREVQYLKDSQAKMSAVLERLARTQDMILKNTLTGQQVPIQQISKTTVTPSKAEKWVEIGEEEPEEELQKGEEQKIEEESKELTESQELILDYVRKNPSKKLGYYMTIISAEKNMKSRDVRDILDMLVKEKYIKIKKKGPAKFLQVA